MKKFLLASATAVSALSMATPSQAAVLAMAGDDDCFGLSMSCADGSLWRDDLGGTFFTSNATAGDPMFTDEWDAFNNPTYSLAFAGGTGLSLEFRIAGIADVGSGYDILVNGISIGMLPQNNNANGFQEVLTYTFAIADGSLLADNTVTIASSGGDGFSVDYVSLLGNVGAVPEPTTWAMMIFGFGLVGGAMRRRKTKVTVSYA
ncbi:MAG: PEPxxWA-CTERM sorting domain-containing protein [Parasphingorhabdus sp.]|uniref:PEPxxWA-CTERM sorting domain-containing protein n=1 Tax=Parasphingorhabdus sp. TaxID=2709688 RepID=UPI0032982D56